MTYIEKFWGPATAADVARVMDGEKVEARFSDEMTAFFNSAITGWRKDNCHPWLDESRSSWRYCQVYAPPQWYLSKPEPGEGYRLLGKFPDEALQPGDEVRMPSEEKWRLSDLANVGGTQHEGAWYRRRIEPKPEPKFAVGQRVKIIGPSRTEKVRYNWEQGMDNQVGKTGVVTGSDDGSFGRFYQLSGIVEWRFQEDYLEPAVEPEPKHYVLQVGDTCDVPSGHRITITEHGVEVT